METYNQREMEEAGIHVNFVQDNQSMSAKGVLRGLHFQKQYPQTKLVRVIKAGFLMLPLTCERVPEPTASGTAWS